VGHEALRGLAILGGHILKSSLVYVLEVGQGPGPVLGWAYGPWGVERHIR
jgi:hypothetical protein